MAAPCNQAQQTTAQSSMTTLLVADGQCPKIRQLLAKSLAPVLWLDGDREPLAAISEELSDRRNQGDPVQTLHWVSHGSPGVLRVGEQKVDRTSLLQAQGLLANWHLRNVALWACQTGADTTFIGLLEELTGSTVWSSDRTLGQLNNNRQNWTLSTNNIITSQQLSLPIDPDSLKTWRHQLSARTGVITLDDTSGNGGVFLGNEYIELGVNANGYFGTTAQTASDLTTAGFEGRQGGLAADIGLTGDADGFGAGTDLRIDYFLPGSPEERWGISYNDGTQKTYSHSGAGGLTTTGSPVVTSASNLAVSSTATQATATYTIGIDNLDINIIYTLNSGEKNYTTDIQVVNNSGASVSDIVFMRSFDPDNTRDLGGSFTTINEIISQYTGPGTASVVSATSQDGDAYDTLAGDQAVIAYRSESDNSSVYLGGFDNTNPAEWLPTATNASRTDTVGAPVTADAAIGLVFDVGTLAAGATSSFSYKMLLGALADLNAFTSSGEWSFSNDYLEEQTGEDLDGSGVIGDGIDNNATPPANLSSATYAAGDDYLVEGTLASTAALDAVKTFFTEFNDARSITFDAASAYKYTNLSGTATNLKTLSSTDLGNVTGTLTVSDSFTAPTALSDLKEIKANFGGSTFAYYGVQGTTKELADARNDSGFDWIQNITAQNGKKSFTLTDLSLNSTHLSALIGTGSDALDNNTYLISQNGLTSNSNAYVGSIGGTSLAYRTDASADATTSYLLPVTSSNSPYTNHTIGLANTASPNQTTFTDFNVTGDDAASGLSLTTHFYGGEQLSHISLSGADLSTTNGYSYRQTAGLGTSSVADDIWTLSLNLIPGQPAISGSVADNSGSSILGLILHTIGSSDVGSSNDLGASVFRTQAWWNDISAQDPTYKFSDICPGININGSNGNAIDFDFYLSKAYLERAFSVDFDAISGGFAASGLSSISSANESTGTYIDVSKSGAISSLKLPVTISDVSSTTAGGSTDLYQVAFSNSSWSQGNLSLVYGPSVASTITGDTSGIGAEDTSAITGDLNATDPQGLTDGTYFSIETGNGPSNGSASINAETGAWSYTPTANFNGTDSFTVTVTDDLSGITTQAIPLTVIADDDPATISGDTSGTGAEDTSAITGTLTATDVDGLTDSTYFSIETGNTPANGSASINAETGAWSYTPTANFNGTDSFTVTITDDAGGTTKQAIALTVTAVDDPATISGDTSGTGAEDASAITGTLTATDVDGLTDSTFFSIETGNGPSNGSASINAETGAWSYTPTANFNGTDSFTVTITDDAGGTTKQAIALTIEPDNNIVEDSGNNENVVTAIVDPNVSLSVEGTDLAQSATDAISTLTSAIDRRDSTEETSLIKTATRFLNQLPPTSQVDVRTIIPTTTSTNDQTIALAGTTNSDDTSQTEAFVIDLRQMTGRTQLQLDNIDFIVIIGPADITGGAGSNHLIADDNNQFILLGDNDDTLVGGGGDDTIGSAGGDDLLIGGQGRDLVSGGQGDDTLRGSSGDDTLNGDAKHDLLKGGGGKDSLFGGKGRDTLQGFSGDDTLNGDSKRDLLKGGSGNDSLFGGKGKDTLIGGEGADIFELSEHRDTIRDFSITDGDVIEAPTNLNLRLIQRGDHLLLKDLDDNIKTTLLNINRDDLLGHQPDLI